MFLLPQWLIGTFGSLSVEGATTEGNEPDPWWPFEELAGERVGCAIEPWIASYLFIYFFKKTKTEWVLFLIFYFWSSLGDGAILVFTSSRYCEVQPRPLSASQRFGHRPSLVLPVSSIFVPVNAAFHFRFFYLVRCWTKIRMADLARWHRLLPRFEPWIDRGCFDEAEPETWLTIRRPILLFLFFFFPNFF